MKYRFWMNLEFYWIFCVRSLEIDPAEYPFGYMAGVTACALLNDLRTDPFFC